ncbi:MAG: hypothetical protein GF398_02050 [Chitinivibrionales bacterium]|nr:hypothetical protein [Chitinivibrionales bacterium]
MGNSLRILIIILSAAKIVSAQLIPYSSMFERKVDSTKVLTAYQLTPSQECCFDPDMPDRECYWSAWELLGSNCTNTLTAQETVIATALHAGLNHAKHLPQQFEAQSSPAGDMRFEIPVNGQTQSTVEIIDMFGRIVLRRSFSRPGSYTMPMPLHAGTGMLFARMKNSKNNSIKLVCK